MEIIEQICNALFVSTLNFIDNAPYLSYFLIAAFTSALIFNIIHVMLGGD